MKRFRGYELTLGILVATIFWLAVAIVYPKYYGSENQLKKSTPETEVETNRRIADYNRALDWLTGFLVVANVALWWVTWRSGVRQSRDMQSAIAAAQTANEISHASMVADQRAWLTVKLTLAEDLVIDHHGCEFGVSAEIKNIGKTPALIRP